ncbi:hypothetical protein ACSYGW_21125 [Bacillus glycinifermentans]
MKKLAGVTLLLGILAAGLTTHEVSDQKAVSQIPVKVTENAGFG